MPMTKQLKQILENLFNREFPFEEVARYEAALTDLIEALSDSRENLPIVNYDE